MAKTIKVHDKAIVLVLNKAEAKAIKYRLQHRNGVRRTKPEIRAELKLLNELGEI
jgi:hypothetical protein